MLERMKRGQRGGRERGREVEERPAGRQAGQRGDRNVSGQRKLTVSDAILGRALNWGQAGHTVNVTERKNGARETMKATRTESH